MYVSADFFSLCNVLHDTMYYIVTPGEIVVAQPCTKVDHVTWLLTHQKYECLVEFFEGKMVYFAC